MKEVEGCAGPSQRKQRPYGCVTWAGRAAGQGRRGRVGALEGLAGLVQWQARWIEGQREMAGRGCLPGWGGWRGRKAMDLRSKEFLPREQGLT